MAISTRGTGTQPIASRPVWRLAANSRREPRANRPARTSKPGVSRWQNAPIEHQGQTRTDGKPPRQNRKVRREPTANRPARTSKPGVSRWQNAPIEYQGQMRTDGKTRQQNRIAGREPKQTVSPERQARKRSTPRPNSEFRIPNFPRRPPRAQTPVPALKPAKRSLSPARNSRSCKAEKRIAASARNTAPPIERPSPRAHSRQRILHVRRAISAPRAQTLLPVCIRRAQTPRRRAIHDHVRQKNAAPRQRGKSA